MESCVNEGSRNDGPPGGDTTPPGGDTTPPGGDTTPPGGDTTPPGGDTTPPVNDPTPPVTGVDIPDSCRRVGISSESDQAYKDLVKYNEQRLSTHNEKRRLHQNTPDLTFDLDIACQAQYWATEHAQREEELSRITVDDDRLVHYG